MEHAPNTSSQGPQTYAAEAHSKHGNRQLLLLQAAGLSSKETNDLLDSYVREQVEEKGAGESHM